MKNKYLEIIGNCGGVFFTLIQTQQVFQIISLILTCLSIAFSVCFTAYKWYKEAIKDRKITEEEINDLIKSVEEEIDKINKGDN